MLNTSERMGEEIVDCINRVQQTRRIPDIVCCSYSDKSVTIISFAKLCGVDIRFTKLNQLVCISIVHLNYKPLNRLL